MAIALRRDDPGMLDSLHSIGGSAMRRTTRGGPQKHGAAALGVSRSRFAHYVSGDPSSPASRFYVAVHALAKYERTSPYPLIAEALAVAKQAGIEAQSVDELVARWKALSEEEHFLEAAQNRANYHGTADEAAAADMAHAEALIERAAIIRELARRGVDPRLMR